jgi:hypothetical protein
MPGVDIHKLAVQLGVVDGLPELEERRAGQADGESSSIGTAG